MSSILYRIRDWNQIYENSESRKCKTLTWVRLPIKLDGNGYKALMEIEGGPGILGCFVALIELAGRSVERGTFTNSSGKPLTTKMISRSISQPEDLVNRTLEVLSSGEFDWIETVALDECVTTPLGDHSSIPGQQSSVLGKSPDRREDGEERRGEPEESQRTERMARGEGGRGRERGAGEWLPPLGGPGFPGGGQPPDPIHEITEAITEVIGSTPKPSVVHALCREPAEDGCHPALVARWIRDKGLARKRSGDPIRTPKPFLDDWQTELRAWVQSNFAALNGGRWALMETVPCKRCGAAMLRFEDGCIVRCACGPVEAKLRRVR